MFVQFVNIAVWLLELYVASGLVFALFFVIKGAGKIDPDAKEGTWGFRSLIFPGTVVLWPFLLKRLRSGLHEPPMEKTPHKNESLKASNEVGGAKN